MAENLSMQCIIKYVYEEKEYTWVIYPEKGWENMFAIKILNRIECLVDGGARISYIERHGI